jgi:hypothetical protein
MNKSNAMQVKENSQKLTAYSQQPTWIWYPGDFEVWLGNIFNNRRTERGAMFPPFWKQDSHWVTVEFSKAFTLYEDEEITIACEGQFNLALDGKLQFGQPKTFLVPKGEHKLNLKVWNQATPPALFIAGKTIHTDSTWLATYEDKLWIDENGVAHGSGIYVPAASWCFNSPDTPPSTYHLEREERRPVCCHAMTTNTTPIPAASDRATVPDGFPSGVLYDFGRETFGYLKVKGLKGTIRIYYGESREEALDKAHCETLDVVNGQLPAQEKATENDYQLSIVNCQLSKAFRFVYIEKDEGASYDEVLMDYEYAPFDESRSGSFRCNDEQLNKIWDVAAYTMDLTTREFFMDGIKRDRWTWSGDAIQSYLMNYYLRFDVECVKRTIRQLRGKDPVTAHINTIMDYTFYWFKSILDYYQYTGDKAFVREMWPRMETMMNYMLRRTNNEGMAEGQPDDWIFVDWVDFPMHKRGTLCFEQILFMKALETMAVCADVLCTVCCDSVATNDVERTVYALSHKKYRILAENLRNKIKQTFWNYDQKLYYHAIEDGQMNRQVTKFPNMFAILYGLSYKEEQEEIMQSVMLNPDIPPITTPYMRFYELETLCMMGYHDEVLKEMRDYWGGMIREGATSFWEKYNPEETGTQHLAMYGRPYGKSLCHAWGASPVYLLGKYYLGVRPTKPGYEEYVVEPHLGDLKWMQGDVPTPFGLIHVEMDRHEIKIRATGGRGTLIVGERQVCIEAGRETIMQI